MKKFFIAFATLLLGASLFSQPRFSSQGHKAMVVAAIPETNAKADAFYTVGQDGFIIRWENGIGEHFQVSDKKIEIAAPAPSGKEIAFYERDESGYHSVKVWSCAAKKVIRSILLKAQVTSLAYSAKGTYIIATTTERNGAYFFLAASGKPFVKIKDWQMSPSWARTSESEKNVMLYSSSEGCLAYFSLKTGKLLKKVATEAGLEKPVLFAKNALFAGVKNGSLYILNAENGAKVKTAAAKTAALFTNDDALYYIDGSQGLYACYKVFIDDNSIKGPLIYKNIKGEGNNQFSAAFLKDQNLYLGAKDGNVYSADAKENSLPSNLALISNEVYQKIHGICSDGQNVYILTNSSIIKTDYENKSPIIFNNSHYWTIISCAHGRLILRSDNRLAGIYSMDAQSGDAQLLFNSQNRIKRVREATVNGQKGFLEIENSKVNFYSFETGELSELYLGSGIQDAAALENNTLAVAKTASSNPTSALVLVNIKTRETVPVKMDGDITVSIEESGGFLFGSRLISTSGGYTSSAFCFGTKALTLKEFASSAKEESESFVRPAFPLVFTNLGSKNVSVINAKSLKKYSLKSGSSLAVDIIKCQGQLATLNEDSSLTWYNVEQPIPLADWYIDSKNQIVEF
jgi:outer membrane protein assembly factor BamB